MTDQVQEKVYNIGLNDLAREAHKNALDNAVWDGKKSQQLSTLLMSVVSELSVILEEDKLGTLQQASNRIPTISRFEEQTANTLIRLMDIIGAYKLNIEMATKLVMTFDKHKGA
jgi:hypothetical protein